MNSSAWELAQSEKFLHFRGVNEAREIISLIGPQRNKICASKQLLAYYHEYKADMLTLAVAIMWQGSLEKTSQPTHPTIQGKNCHDPSTGYQYPDSILVTPVK